MVEMTVVEQEMNVVYVLVMILHEMSVEFQMVTIHHVQMNGVEFQMVIIHHDLQAGCIDAMATNYDETAKLFKNIMSMVHLHVLCKL